MTWSGDPIRILRPEVEASKRTLLLPGLLASDQLREAVAADTQPQMTASPVLRYSPLSSGAEPPPV